MAYKVYDMTEFMQMDFPEQKWLLYPLVKEKGTAMISAGTGVGKTFFALTIALAVSTGTSFLKFKASEPHKVLYVDGEMSAKELQERLKLLSVGLGIDSQYNPNITIWTSDTQPDMQMPNLTRPDGQKNIEDCLAQKGIELIIFDNLSVLCNGIHENDADAWAKFQEWLLGLRRRGYSVLEIQHHGKGGEYRGSSKQQDILTCAISLKRPEQYKKSDGAKFEVHFTKTRGICGDDISPYEASLDDTEQGDGLKWFMSDVSSEKLEQRQQEIKKAKELRAQGKTQTQIATEMGCSIGKVNGLLNAD